MMKGLLYKDFQLMLKNGKMFLALIVFFGVVMPVAASGSESGKMAGLQFAAMMITLMFVTLGISSIAYDSQAKWDVYVLSLPVGRNIVVGSKYGIAALSAAAGLVFTALIGLVTGVLSTSVGWWSLGLSMLAAAAFSLLYAALMLPLQIKFGAEKSRVVMLVFVFAIYGVAYLVMGKGGQMDKIIAFFANAHLSLPLLAVAGILLTAILYIVSYGISLRIYGNKEF